MEIFKTINNDACAEFVEKKSKFIAHAFYVETIEDAENKVKQIKKKYYDAKHNCFAYAIETADGGIAVKYNDDGEPQGTAGAPILKVILGMDLSNILVIVTRYFGGVLLGTGGLVRAYTTATAEVLKECEIVNKIFGEEASVQIEYDELSNIKFFCEKNKIKIVKISYLEKIELIIEVTEEDKQKITAERAKKTINILNFTTVRQKNIEK